MGMSGEMRESRDLKAIGFSSALISRHARHNKKGEFLARPNLLRPVVVHLPAEMARPDRSAWNGETRHLLRSKRTNNTSLPKRSSSPSRKIRA